jgi:DNA-binding GntR family transcriptional regulator
VLPQLLKLTASTLADDCYASLKNAILDLTFPPDMPLDEGQLAAQLGTSKTPVREALARLSGEGFVIGATNRRTLVAPLSAETTREVYSIRLMLEPASLRTVAAQLTKDDLDRLQRTIDRSQSSPTKDIESYVHSAENFHSILIAKTNNNLLMAMAGQLFDRANRIRAAIYRVEQQEVRPTSPVPGLENHQRIVDALRDGDAEQAARALAHDIQGYLELTNSEPWQAAFARLAYQPEQADRR